MQVIVFETCTPTVTDLPRRYQWRTASTIRGDVCFRYVLTTIYRLVCNMNCKVSNFLRFMPAVVLH